MNTTVKTLIFWLVILGSAIALWQVVKSQSSSSAVPEISYSEFMLRVNAGDVARVTVTGTHADGTFRNGTGFEVNLPTSQDQMLATLQQRGVEIRYTAANNSPSSWWLNLMPLGLLAVLWFYMVRRIQDKKKLAANGPSATSNTPWPQS